MKQTYSNTNGITTIECFKIICMTIAKPIARMTIAYISIGYSHMSHMHVTCDLKHRNDYLINSSKVSC